MPGVHQRRTFGIVAVFWEALPPAFLVAVLLDPQGEEKGGLHSTMLQYSALAPPLVEAAAASAAIPHRSEEVCTQTQRDEMPAVKRYADLNI